MTTSMEACARTLWDYLTVRHELERSQAILVLGRDDMNIARRALQLYVSGLTSTLVLVGGRGRMSGSLADPESLVFRRFLISEGVPSAAILTDEKSSNTTENIREGLAFLTNRRPIALPIGIITHGPHSRRALASARGQAPSVRFLSYPDECSLPPLGSGAYTLAASELVGEVDRLIEYPALGFPVAAEEVPAEVLNCRQILDTWRRGLKGD